MDKAQIFDKKSTLILLLFCLPLLWIPKINLISFSGQSAGLRIDDILLLCFAFLFFWAQSVLKKEVFSIEKIMWSLLGLSCLSFFFNRLFVFFGWIHVDAKIYYCFRVFEYFLFFYIGLLSYSFISAFQVARGLFWANALVIFLQKVGWVGGFTIHGYFPHISDRTMGLASFPSETGGVLSILFAYLIFSEQKQESLFIQKPAWLQKIGDKCGLIAFFLLTCVLVVFTGSRIALASVIVSFAIKLKEEIKKGWIAAPILIPLGLVCSFFVVTQAYLIIERSPHLLSFSNIELAAKVWDKIDTRNEPGAEEAVSYKNYDMSWWIRIHKWCYALKLYLQHPESYLQGIGPGFATAALDGGFLRIVVEHGLLGAVAFAALFRLLMRQSLAMKMSTLAFLMNMIFFDAYLAYKPMSLLFFLAGQGAFFLTNKEPCK